MHIPVLPRPVVELLNPQPGQTCIDCTAGLGGHASAIAERVGPTGRIVLFDLDAGNLARAAERVRSLPGAPEVLAFHTSFTQAPRLLAERGLKADLVLADLGFASNQIEDPGRGFSFMEGRGGPLDMRLDASSSSPITAAELVNTMTERELAEMIRDHGEEPPAIARRIAANLVSARAVEPINTTTRLATIVRAAVPARSYAGIDPATKTFQALRIAVNDELGSLAALLASIERAAGSVRRGADGWLNPGARIGIISFHSLEDRPVKQTFNRLVEQDLAASLTRKAVQADEAELAANPRSRSARLRAIRIGGHHKS
ncbi:MAG: 16S rRNA (cytosine(1402)-N(4))-methyltransferase RsmH [Phycisphaerales bacterium]|nr:16S rRNA (cytosine(1402)-N(4))-methyltransferase RsmH [Phycisphaerales bacterium]